MFHYEFFTRRRLVLSALAVLAMVGSSVRAQSATGSWETGFDHSITAPTATDFLVPFTGTGNTGFVAPAPSGNNFPMFGWGWQPTFYLPEKFNAVHAALIPKGSTKNRGKVLVWNRYPVVFRPGAPFDSTNFWVFQAWSIIDTSPGAVQKFKNFVLPLQSFGPTPPPQNPPTTAPVTVRVGDVFCSGHAWSQNGDLVVAGGEKFDLTVSTTGFITETPFAARSLFLFNPELPSAPFPGQPSSSSLYPLEFGAWLQQSVPAGGVVELHADRYYPTVTFSQKLTRLNNEVVMVSGGTDSLATIDPENTYETWIVGDPLSPPFLQPDSLPDQPGYGTSSMGQPNLEMDWLQEYPRLNLWGDGRIFNSGYAYKPGRINMEQVATALGFPSAPWDQTIGQTGSNWQSNREGGTTVHIAKLGSPGAVFDLIVRLCGSGSLGTTATSEGISRVPSVGWTSLGTVPAVPPSGRNHTNAVVLPCGSIVVFGGDNNGTPVYTTAMLINGIGWSALPAAADSPTNRQYHATALLLEDGRVFVGGGEGRGIDYTIFRPWYLQGTPPPKRPSIVSITNGPPNTVTNSDDTWILHNLDSGLKLTASLDTTSDAPPTEFLARLVLIAPGSITHHTDMTARYVELDSQLVSGTINQRTFSVPDGNILPRGFYMLFALNNANIPSIAEWVWIR